MAELARVWPRELRAPEGVGLQAPAARDVNTASPRTQNPRTRHLCVEISGKSSMDLGIAPLEIENPTESKP